MSIAKRAEHMSKLMSRYSQRPFYNKFRDAYLEADDFTSFDADDDYTVTDSGSASSTIDVIDGAGGLLEIDAVSSTVDKGGQVQHKTETFLPAADKHIIFETRLKVSDAIATFHMFVGLSALDASLLVSTANTSPNHIGFENITTATSSLVSEKAGTRGSNTSAATLVEDTYIILGFFVDGVTQVVPLVNGVAGTAITSGSTTTPVTELAATYALASDGDTDPIMTVDWYYCIQIR